MVETKALGIFQSDIIIRTAIMAGLHEMRLKPYLLDFCFASLAKDDLTKNRYGEKEIAEAKRWFLSTDVAVVINRRLGEVQFPCITIAIMKSSESNNTLADVNYEKREASQLTGWNNISDSFNPLSYNRSTGIMVIPEAISKQLLLTAGQILVTRNGNQYKILEVISRSKDNPNTIVLDTNINDEFNGSVFRGAFPPKLLMFGNARFQETYAIGTHVQSEAIHLTYLHSILTFVLLRNRKALIEGRGFEVTALDSGDFGLARYFEGVEAQPIFTRFISISGAILQWWVESEEDRINNTLARPKVIGGGKFLSQPDNDAPIVGDEDDDIDIYGLPQPP